MLARTHGQPASLPFSEKKYLYLVERLKTADKNIEEYSVYAKFGVLPAILMPTMLLTRLLTGSNLPINSPWVLVLERQQNTNQLNITIIIAHIFDSLKTYQYIFLILIVM